MWNKIVVKWTHESERGKKKEKKEKGEVKMLEKKEQERRRIREEGVTEDKE